MDKNKEWIKKDILFIDKDDTTRNSHAPAFLRMATVWHTLMETSPMFWFPPRESWRVSESYLAMTKRVTLLATIIPPFPYFCPLTYGAHEKIQ